jgi:hypothetical protein
MVETSKPHFKDMHILAANEQYSYDTQLKILPKNQQFEMVGK